MVQSRNMRSKYSRNRDFPESLKSMTDMMKGIDQINPILSVSSKFIKSKLN